MARKVDNDHGNPSFLPDGPAEGAGSGNGAEPSTGGVAYYPPEPEDPEVARALLGVRRAAISAEEISAQFEMLSSVERHAIGNWFSYHSPHPSQVPRYNRIREKARELAVLIFSSTPPSPERDESIRTLRIAVMQANAAIACGEGL